VQRPLVPAAALMAPPGGSARWSVWDVMFSGAPVFAAERVGLETPLCRRRSQLHAASRSTLCSLWRQCASRRVRTWVCVSAAGLGPGLPLVPYMTPAMLKAAAWAPVFLNREAGDGGALQLSACIPWCIAAQASQRQTEGILCYFAVRKFTGLASPALACKGRAIHSACAGRGAFPPTSVTRDCLLLPTSNDMPVSHLPAQTLVYACRLCS